jgi:putative addiction module component (TIGR02574 family)
MSQTTEQLRAELAKLPMQQRAELASFLISSLDAEWDAETEAAWDAELARREEEVLAGRAKGEQSNIVFAKLLKKYS